MLLFKLKLLYLSAADYIVSINYEIADTPCIITMAVFL